MTDDLVTRLRGGDGNWATDIVSADIIEALTARAEAAEAERDAMTAERDLLRKALKPFANYANTLKGWEPTEHVCSTSSLDFKAMAPAIEAVTAGDFFAARAALKGEQK